MASSLPVASVVWCKNTLFYCFRKDYCVAAEDYEAETEHWLRTSGLTMLESLMNEIEGGK